jgi:hypothetical protein
MVLCPLRQRVTLDDHDVLFVRFLRDHKARFPSAGIQSL